MVYIVSFAGKTYMNLRISVTFFVTLEWDSCKSLRIDPQTLQLEFLRGNPMEIGCVIWPVEGPFHLVISMLHQVVAHQVDLSKARASRVQVIPKVFFCNFMGHHLQSINPNRSRFPKKSGEEKSSSDWWIFPNINHPAMVRVAP